MNQQWPSLLRYLTTTLFLIFLLNTSLDAATDKNRYGNRKSHRTVLNPRGKGKTQTKERSRSSKPNIVVILTDDQDVMLGSMDVMNKTRRILGEGGATFTNAFVTTPMCCPSRSTILTGLHTHNHEVYTNNEHCGSLSWRRGPETKTFATYLQREDYRTGYFGKYLNTYNGTYIPPGWMEWVGLIRNSRFYNYTINRNGNKIRHSSDYHDDYLTDLIANDSVTFFKLSKQVYPTRPVAIVLSMPAPHGPEDAAPQYQHMFNGVMTHRTETWNVAPNHDKHWIFQYTGKMTPKMMAFTDVLQQKRLQTLLSVDDAVEKIYNMLKDMDELDNTFILFTSDHGYHAGQFGLVKGKSMPYEFDVRVPFYIRGPNIPGGIEIPSIVLNVDIAPTILDMAGISNRDDMDGKSALKLVYNGNGTRGRPNGRKRRLWRDTFLIERGLFRIPTRYKDYVNYRSNYLPKDERMREECSKLEYQSPCQPNQAKECVQEGGTLRFRKCRVPKVRKERKRKPKKKKRRCQCNRSQLSKKEKKSQRKFLKDHVSQDDYKPRFMRDERDADETGVETMFQGANPDITLADGSIGNAVVIDPKCQINKNGRVVCEDEIFASQQAWMEHRQFLSKQIESLKDRINNLKDIREFVVDKKPRRGKVCICEDEETEEEEDEDEDEEIIEEEEEEEDEEEIEEEEEEIYVEDEEDDSSKKNRKENLSDLDNDALLSRYAEKLQKKFDLTEEEIDQMVEKKANKLKKEEKKEKNPKSPEEEACSVGGMSCFYQTNDHWTTPPLWNLGSFCFCPNSINNTYWCLRTINRTHDFLYCEFITGFIEYFDMRPGEDPLQMWNRIHSMPLEIRHQLHDELMLLRECKGAKECNPRPKSPPGEVYEPYEDEEDETDPDRMWRGWRG
ncbi:extracellular sulfatase Sulf-1-like [Glandiceps talaboti]